MAKAKQVHSTPRKTASKIQPKTRRKTEKAKPERSKIIEQCVIYLQSKAAFKTGFDADVGDNEFARCGKGASTAPAISRRPRWP
jgi:hypothetical protein